MRRILYILFAFFFCASLHAQSGTLTTQGVTVEYTWTGGVLSWEASGSVPSGRHTILTLEPGDQRVGNWPFVTNIDFSGQLAVDAPRTLFLGVYLAESPWTLLGSQQVDLQSLSAQTISAQRSLVQPAMAGVQESWTVSGMAAGASLQIGGGVSNGAENCNVIVSGSQLLVTPIAPGPYSFSVYATATSTHSQSNTLQLNSTAGEFTFTYTFRLSNTNNYPLQWRVMQGSTELQSGSVPVGALVQTITGTTPVANPLPRLQVLQQYKYDEALGIHHKSPEWVDMATLQLTQSQSSGEWSAQSSGDPQQVGKNSTAWQGVNSSNSNDLLTKGVYAEGASKIEDSIRGQASALSGSSASLQTAANSLQASANSIGSASASLSAAASEIGNLASGVDRTAEATEATDSKLGTLLDWLGLGDGGGQTTTLAQAEGQAASRANYAAAGGVSVSSASNVSGVGSAAVAAQTISVAGRDIKLSLSPSEMGELAGGDEVLRDSKPLVLVALVLAFFGIVGREMSRLVQSLSQVQASDSAVGIENLVPGVAQGKTWGAAAIVAGALVAFAVSVVVLIASISGGVGVQLAGVGNVSVSAIGHAVAWLEQYLPIVPMVTLGVAAATCHYWLLPLYLGAASLLKFIKA